MDNSLVLLIFLFNKLVLSVAEIDVRINEDYLEYFPNCGIVIDKVKEHLLVHTSLFVGTY